MEVRVYTNLEAYSSGRYLYARRVLSVDSVSVPFELLLRSLRYLYGSDCIVVFIND